MRKIQIQNFGLIETVMENVPTNILSENKSLPDCVCLTEETANELHPTNCPEERTQMSAPSTQLMTSEVRLRGNRFLFTGRTSRPIGVTLVVQPQKRWYPSSRLKTIRIRSPLFSWTPTRQCLLHNHNRRMSAISCSALDDVSIEYSYCFGMKFKRQ